MIVKASIVLINRSDHSDKWEVFIGTVLPVGLRPFGLCCYSLDCAFHILLRLSKWRHTLGRTLFYSNFKKMYEAMKLQIPSILPLFVMQCLITRKLVFNLIFPFWHRMASTLGKRLVACLLNVSEARRKDLVVKVAQAAITNNSGE